MILVRRGLSNNKGMDVRTRFEAAMDKINAVETAEEKGLIADSQEVRLALMEKVHSGEITLQAAQDQLKKIKRDAKKQGLITRQQAFSQG